MMRVLSPSTRTCSLQPKTGSVRSARGPLGATRSLCIGLLFSFLPACAHQTALGPSPLDDPNPPALTCAELQGEVVALRKAYRVLSDDLLLTQRIGGVALVIEGAGLIFTNVYAIPTAAKKTADGIAAGMR
jgi:hypothetical protein